MVRDEKSNRSDAELTRLAAGGDVAAFEEIHSRCRSLVTPSPCASWETARMHSAKERSNENSGSHTAFPVQF
jgi:hypothetical protein